MRNELVGRWIVIGLALAAGACSSVLRPGHPYEVPPGPRDLDAASPHERYEYMRRAQVWRDVPTASLDLLKGPPGDDAFDFEAPVTCDYDPNKGRGHSPKFNCSISKGDTVKVKYGRDNGEVYGEVAATRLFWALGFGTDRQYPVRVTCRGCPADPWKAGLASASASATFDTAIIERPPAGKTIEVRKAPEGWAWSELRAIDERLGGATRAQVDALRLLAAFVQHGDNKGEQQRLVCELDGVERNALGNETCTRPFLLTVDLGTTFGRASLANRHKFRLHEWASVPVWKDPKRCVARLRRSFTGTMGDPRISEAGRAFLAELLGRLSDEQVRDLFTAARADRRGERMEFDGVERQVTVDDWVAVFRRKRAEIMEHHCPE